MQNTHFSTHSQSIFHLMVWILITLASFPQVSFSQAPPLGTTESFAVFTAIGAIDNIGASVITGDLGTNAGAITGFPPGTLIGALQEVNAVTAQAAIDVEAAYTYMVGLTCGSTIGATLGSGQTLTPNTYCIVTAGSLDGDLTLDALGDPNALFIFKINGAFSTATFSNILLINDANVCNVYWQVGGLFTLSDNSAFKGTVISDGGHSVLGNANMEGRLLARAGAISFDTNTVTMNCGAPLPIRLYSFTAQCEAREPLLRWITNTELNNDFFTVERSVNASNWQVIGQVDGAGNSTNKREYAYMDNEFFDHAYYRLKQTDFDGTFEYSSALFLEVCAIESDIRIHPNPSTGIINMTIGGTNSTYQSIVIYSLQGKRLYYSENVDSKIDLSSAAEGIYFLHLSSPTNTTITKFIIDKSQ